MVAVVGSRRCTVAGRRARAGEREKTVGTTTHAAAGRAVAAVLFVDFFECQPAKQHGTVAVSSARAFPADHAARRSQQCSASRRRRPCESAAAAAKWTYAVDATGGRGTDEQRGARGRRDDHTCYRGSWSAGRPATKPPSLKHRSPKPALAETKPNDCQRRR